MATPTNGPSARQLAAQAPATARSYRAGITAISAPSWPIIRAGRRHDGHSAVRFQPLRKTAAGLDRRFKRTGTTACLLPRFVQRVFLKREAKHVDGFAPEVAGDNEGGRELQERLAIRRRARRFIGHFYSKWRIQSGATCRCRADPTSGGHIVRWEKKKTHRSSSCARPSSCAGMGIRRIGLRKRRTKRRCACRRGTTSSRNRAPRCRWCAAKERRPPAAFCRWPTRPTASRRSGPTVRGTRSQAPAPLFWRPKLRACVDIHLSRPGRQRQSPSVTTSWGMSTSILGGNDHDCTATIAA